MLSESVFKVNLNNSMIGLHKSFTGFSIEEKRPLSDEKELLRLLFDGYNPTARPMMNSSHTVDVKIQFSLLQIQDW